MNKRRTTKVIFSPKSLFSHILGYGLTHSRQQIKLNKCYLRKKVRGEEEGDRGREKTVRRREKETEKKDSGVIFVR